MLPPTFKEHRFHRENKSATCDYTKHMLYTNHTHGATQNTYYLLNNTNERKHMIFIQ